MTTNEPLFSFRWEGKAVGVNKRYAHRSTKVLTPEYEAFMDDIAWTCRANSPGLASHPISTKLFVRFTQFIDAARDSDSLIKPLFDGIELSGVITNDNKIRNYTCITIDHTRMAADMIEVKAYDLDSET